MKTLIFALGMKVIQINIKLHEHGKQMFDEKMNILSNLMHLPNCPISCITGETT